MIVHGIIDLESVKYTCNVINVTSNMQNKVINLTAHIKSRHECVKYACN